LTDLRKISKIGALGTVLFLPMGGGPTVVGSDWWAVVRCSNITLSLPNHGGLFIFSKNANWTSWILGEIVEGDEGCYGKVLVAKTVGGF
jgi:hypothetical protein